MEFIELTNEQRRQLIDAQQVYAAWRPASADLERMGSLIWQTSRGKRYLTEQHGKVRKSLGRETPELRAKKETHVAKRKALTAKVKGLKKRLDQMAPVNRALKLGRMPTIAANILRELDREGLLVTSSSRGRTHFTHTREQPALSSIVNMWQPQTQTFVGLEPIAAAGRDRCSTRGAARHTEARLRFEPNERRRLYRRLALRGD